MFPALKVIMVFYMLIVGLLIGSNFARAGCQREQRSQESRTVVECDFGEGITNRVLSEDEEDEREDVASV